jgi:hypothetical protein
MQRAIARVIAILLSIGGVYWAILLSPLISRADNRLLPLVVFGPGYMATAACIYRSCTTPGRGGRLLIWALSSLVQGGWLASHMVATLAAGGSSWRLLEPPLVVAWLSSAAVGYIIGLYLDRE